MIFFGRNETSGYMADGHNPEAMMSDSSTDADGRGICKQHDI